MKTSMRNTETNATFKISGTNVTETIDLQTDLLIPNRLVLAGATQTVTITDMTWSGMAGSTFTITRNGVKIFGSVADAPHQIIFFDMDYNENQEQTSDIVVAITGEAYVYVGMRKVSGYKQTTETELFGQYDNPLVAGS